MIVMILLKDHQTRFLSILKPKDLRTECTSSARHCATRLLNTTTAQSCKYNIRVYLFFRSMKTMSTWFLLLVRVGVASSSYKSAVVYNKVLTSYNFLVKYYFQNKWDFQLRASPSERVITHSFHNSGRLNFWTESVTLTFPIYKTKLLRQIQSQTR